MGILINWVWFDLWAIENIKCQILTDFIVEHEIDLGDEISYLTSTPWKLYLMDWLVKKAKMLA
jgi:hypothetical protein